jgi:hypothetical protein
MSATILRLELDSVRRQLTASEARVNELVAAAREARSTGQDVVAGYMFGDVEIVMRPKPTSELERLRRIERAVRNGTWDD